MYKTLKNYKKEKDYLIAVDSDGCVMDNMTVKHQDYFFPLILTTFGFNDSDGSLGKLWDEINLEYPSRGINRFLGLGRFLKEVALVDGTQYYEWLETTEVLSNDAIEDAINSTDDSVMKKVLIWSKAVNEKIKKELDCVKSFKYASESIKKAAEVADVVIMSSANHDAIISEWSEAGILGEVQFVASQDVGTKKDCIKDLIEKGYSSKKVLMVGDARGDYYAAKASSAQYYQITYKEEVASWKKFNETVLGEFLADTYLYDGDEVLEIALEDALKVIRVNVDDYTDHFQHVSDDGVYPKEFNKLWTMSFYPGQQFLAYKMTGDEAYIAHKDQVLASFKERCDHGHMATHDIGFLFELTAYYDYLYTGNEESKELVLKAADKLMDRYRSNGGYIQAWGQMDSDEEQTRIIIDCMMNLPLLHIAAKLTGRNAYKEAAISHAKVSSKTLLRDDATTFHTYWMDKNSGKPVKGATHQGHQDDSTWARGQAWSVYGFYKSYEWTKDTYFLDAAVRSADVFIKNLPKNDTCYWDFDFTDENPDIKDTSAAAIAVAGLLKIAKVVDVTQGEYYAHVSKQILMQLANRYQNNEATKGCGILKEGMYHRDQGFNEYTSWGDYYYFEALSTFFNYNTGYEEM